MESAERVKKKILRPLGMDMVANMKVDKVADMKVDKVANMEVDLVVGKVAYRVAHLVAKMEVKLTW